MLSLFDILTVFFWALAYIFIIAAGKNSPNKQLFPIPYSAVILNLSWELCALIHSGFWGHYIWALLDIIIVKYGLTRMQRKYQMLFLCSLGLSFCFCLYIFTLFRGMYYSVYIIDFAIAIIYLIRIKRISIEYKVCIAALKLLGSFCAGLTIEKDPMLFYLYIITLIINIIYLLLCIQNRKLSKTNSAHITSK